MTLPSIIILGLATYRLSVLFAYEDGPANIFERLRYFIGVRVDEYGEMYGKNIIAEMVICTHCNSFWLALFWSACFYVWPETIWFALVFALSGFVVIVER